MKRHKDWMLDRVNASPNVVGARIFLGSFEKNEAKM